MTKQRKIKLSSIQDAKKFVALANECDFDINVRFNHFIIDAKSILGVMGLDFNSTLTVKFLFLLNNTILVAYIDISF